MICPLMSYHAGNTGGCRQECRKEQCAFWSIKHDKCSITVLAEKDININVTTGTQERISY